MRSAPQPLHSCLYECSVMHHRLAPKVRHFQHDIFMFYLDLDELETIARAMPLFGYNRNNIYSFRDADHEPAGPNTLKERMLAFLRNNGVATGRVRRVLGYIFNPVSIYFCFDAEGAPVCSVAEVGNTFREMKLYLLRGEELEAG